jgi:peptidoglycan/xylan/chitin deacetylase (PgdA/CDA1 family)
MRSTSRISVRASAVRIFLCLVAMLALPTIASAHAAPTVVTFTFDDGIKSQNIAKTQLAAHGMKGTFFINTGKLNSSDYYMNSLDVDALAAAGNEIGGHTFSHPWLPDLDAAGQRHEICDDAATLRNRGYTVTSFAYPHGAGTRDETIKSLLIECGYQVARKVGDLNGPLCLDCPFVNIPPAEPYRVYSNESVEGPLTLDMLKGYVTATEQHGGGWVPLTFHDICDDCADADYVSPATFNAFLDWLKLRTAGGTVVKTMRAAVAGSLPVPTAVKPIDKIAPTTDITCDEDPCESDWYDYNPTVAFLPEDLGGSGVASTRYTTDGSIPTTRSTKFDAPFTVSKTTVFKYRTYDGAGNAEATKTSVVRIDTTPPVVGTLYPLSNMVLSSRQTTTIVAGALDVLGSGVSGVDFYVDGELIGHDGPGLLSSATWKPTVGKHVITVKATDNVGNEATSNPVTVTVR